MSHGLVMEGCVLVLGVGVAGVAGVALVLVLPLVLGLLLLFHDGGSRGCRVGRRSVVEGLWRGLVGGRHC